MATQRPDVDASFSSSVFRSNFRLLVPVATESALPTFAAFGDLATINAAINAANAGTANGYFWCGAGDGVEFMVVGNDAADETITYRLEQLIPVFDEAREHAGWAVAPVAAGTITLGTAVVGAAGAVLGTIASTDLVADTITNTITNADVQALSPANNTTALLRAKARGAQGFRLHLARGTAAAYAAIARRIQGDAQRVG